MAASPERSAASANQNNAARTGRSAPAKAIDQGERALLGVLLALTVLSGLVDAVCYLGLGHVFTANMTGNVVLLGFAAAGAPGFSVTASLTSLSVFLLGAVCGGRITAVPDMTTTVLTMTLTGLAADSTLAGGGNPHAGRRVAAVLAMLIGAVVGASLLLHRGAALPLAVSAAAAAATAVAAYASQAAAYLDKR
jgi:uncharacterized membrane protein YoaK (UPF0700 family)